MNAITIARISLAIAVAAILFTTPGCAVLLTGYLVGDAIATNKRVEECRSNLKITNEQRLREGKDLFPDQCGK
jgi:hypothetical protein